MTATKDTNARRIAMVALAAAFGGYFFNAAQASSVSEPDAYALTQRVNVLEASNQDLQSQVADLSNRADTLDDTTSNLASASDCLAYSEFHAYRETIGDHGKKYWALPVVLYNMASPDCRPDPTRIWKPKRSHHHASRVFSR